MLILNSKYLPYVHKQLGEEVRKQTGKKTPHMIFEDMGKFDIEHLYYIGWKLWNKKKRVKTKRFPYFSHDYEIRN